MLQAVWFDAGPDASGRLLLVIHHLAVDGVSWRILLPDLEAACTAAMRGTAVALPTTGTSFRRWAQALGDDAQSPARMAELPLWTAMTEAPSLALTGGALDPARDLTGGARELTLTLPSDITGALLTRTAAAFHAGVNDVLLTALALAVADWCRRQGRGADHQAVLVDVEGHGREEHALGAAAEGLDLSRTVGWFTSLYPVRLDLGTVDLDEALASGDAMGAALKSIKEQLRALPDHGLGYGLLRYLNPQTAATLATRPVPQIGFNYLGRFAALWRHRQGWTTAPEAIGLTGGGDPELALAHAVEVNAVTLDGAEGPQLQATWTWAPALLVRHDGARPGAGLVPGARRTRHPCGAARRRRPHAGRPAAGGAGPARDRGDRAALPAHRRYPAAGAAAGGPAVPCAL